MWFFFVWEKSFNRKLKFIKTPSPINQNMQQTIHENPQKVTDSVESELSKSAKSASSGGNKENAMPQK